MHSEHLSIHTGGVTLVERDVLCLVVRIQSEKSTSIHTSLQSPSQWFFRRLNMAFMKIGSYLLLSALLVFRMHKNFFFVLTALQICIWWQRHTLAQTLLIDRMAVDLTTFHPAFAHICSSKPEYSHQSFTWKSEYAVLGTVEQAM